NLTILFFIDELNTTAYMGRLKELLVDRSWENDPLPSNVFIVAAINPQRIVDPGVGMSTQIDFSNSVVAKRQFSSESVFDVRIHHPSMDDLVYYFDSMDQMADDDFWESMIELGDTEICEEERRTMIEYVLLGQQQVRL